MRPPTQAARAIGRIQPLSAGTCARAHSPTLQPLIFDDWLVELLEELDVPEGIEPHREPVASDVTVFIDPHRFRRAVINVYENAMQATSATSPSARPDGGACVRIGTQVTAGRFEISVSDSGPGIAPETLATIFEPLYSTKSFGVGLGLPTVKQIREQHGGA